VPWADEAEQQLPRLAPSAWELSGDIRIFWAGLLEAPRTDTPIPGLRFKFEVARQASCPSLFAFVRAVLWANQAEQQLSRLAPSGCQLSGHIRIFGAGQMEAPGTDTLRYIW